MVNILQGQRLHYMREVNTLVKMHIKAINLGFGGFFFAVVLCFLHFSDLAEAVYCK